MDLNTKFSTTGIDSLQATTSQAYLIHKLNLSDHNLSQNLIFDVSNVAKLAKYLHALQTVSFVESQASLKIMQDLVTKDSNFKPFKSRYRTPDSKVVVKYISPLTILRTKNTGKASQLLTSTTRSVP